MSNKSYDVIGDIHGYASELIKMLNKLGYINDGNGFFHPDNRIVVFTGDYVDGGNENLEVIDIVMKMVKRQSAKAILGNHDFNIICFNKNVPGSNTQYLRKHSRANSLQCLTTQSEIDLKPEKGKAALEFLMSLPLWLELDGLRFVHAHWDTEAMKSLSLYMNNDNILSEYGYFKASAGQGEYGDARSSILSGPEIECKPYRDRFGIERKKDRLKWWNNNQSHNNIPIFFGHYAMKPPLKIINNTICVDAGIAKGRSIAAYRHTVGENLKNENFIYSE